MAATKERKLSLRERKFIKYLSQGHTQKDAALKAGYSAKHIESFASHKIKETQVAKAFTQILIDQGVTDEKLGIIISQGIEANKVISCNVIVEEGMKDANSMTKDFIDVPDWIARHKFVDTALKLSSKYPAEKKEITGANGMPIEHLFVVEFVNGEKDNDEN